MVDCHVHFPQIDMIGSYGEQLLDWLTKYTFPAEERFSCPKYAAKVSEEPLAPSPPAPSLSSPSILLIVRLCGTAYLPSSVSA